MSEAADVGELKYKTKGRCQNEKGVSTYLYNLYYIFLSLL